MIIFSNNDRNYHGHPDPLKVPKNIRRNNLIMYYYSPIQDNVNNKLRTKVGELSEYKQRKLGEFGKGYYIDKLLKFFKKF